MPDVARCQDERDEHVPPTTLLDTSLTNSPRLVRFSLANESDAAEITALRVATSHALTEEFGRGHWSSEATERGVLAAMRQSQLWIARRGKTIVGTFCLATKKPWAIDRQFFSGVKRPLYLTDMAVLPALRRKGIGRRCIAKAIEVTRVHAGDAIFLDAYDAEAGAGEFYAKCGFTEVAHVAFRGVPLVYYQLLLTPE